MGNYTIFYMFENPRRGMQARNFTTNVPKILDLKSSSEQIFFRKLSLGAPDRSFAILFPVKTVMTKNVVHFVIAVIWLGALAFSLPLMVASKTKQFNGTDFLSCAEFWAPMSASTYSLFLIIGGYIIPLIIIAAVYSLAGIRLWKRLGN